MKKRDELSGIVILVLAAVVGLSGCAQGGKVTGGGWIPSASGEAGEKANFGFNAEECTPDEVKGHFNYHDKALEVKMNGPVIDAGECVEPFSNPNLSLSCLFCTLTFPGLPAYGIEVAYRSTNPALPGTGNAIACVTDNGEGANATSADLGRIFVLSGPYAGYQNAGPVQGNIQAHRCPS
jgi:hypothetical protein